MLDQTEQIDLSSLADLARIKQEELLLRDRLAKMEPQKEKVSSIVYQRVRKDYESRQAALDAESRPLKDRVRREYAKLQGLRLEVERALEEATLRKEELEFRRDLGEFPDEQIRDRLADCEKERSERNLQLDDVVKLKERFVAAFHSEQELEPSPGAETPEGASAPHASVVPSEASERRAPRQEPVPSPPVPKAARPPVATPPVPASPDATVIVSGILMKPAAGATGKTTARAGQSVDASPPAQSPAATLPGPRSKMEPPPSPTPAGSRAAQESATRLLEMPRIVTLVDDQPTEEYALKQGITSIGRSPDNQIRLVQTHVSRHHANIVLTPAGYSVIDLGADNGVYVNGQRVKEHSLADGDIIQIGTQKLMYKD